MELLKIAIYILCFLTSSACAGLLWRGYGRSGTHLLLWSAICFGFLAGNNLAVILDIMVFPTVDLQLLRHGLALAAVTTLLVGLVWESE
jgi:Family of unknown function (DUF5985)